MSKIAYNACYGGFNLSHDGIMRYAQLKGTTLYAFVDARLADGKPLDTPHTERYRRATEKEANSNLLVHYCTTPEYSNESYLSPYDIYGDRNDPILIQVIEELRDRANGHCSKIKLHDLPAGTLYRIDEYDGLESVATNDSYEWSVAR